MKNLLDFSQVGQVVVTSTDAVVGDFYALQVIAEAVVASMTWKTGYAVEDGAGSPADWSDFTAIPVGTILYGRFSALTLTSGEVILHKANPNE